MLYRGDGLLKSDCSLLLGLICVFQKAPSPFTKLMTVHGRFRGKFIPLAFVLLHKDPNQAIYEEIYTMLPRMNNLQAFVVDYDLAQINALKNLYPTIWVSFFRFSGSNVIFHASKMRAIDFSPRNYPKKSVLQENRKKIFPKKFTFNAVVNR
jgi:hypothetical protein